MAQFAAEIGKRPGPAKTVKREPGGEGAASATVPLELAPLLAPYKDRGRLSLRIERVPREATLSAGRNNNDGSWSLAAEDVDGLSCRLPRRKEEGLSLGVKIFKLDRGIANMLAVLEFLVAPGAQAASAEAKSQPRTTPSSEIKEVERLHREAGELKHLLAERDLEVSRLRQKQSAAEPSKDQIEAELACARAAWSKETEERVAAVAAKAAQELEQQRKAWEAELATAQERWRSESEAAVAKAEAASKAETEALLAAAATQRQEELAKAVAEARAQSQSSHEEGQEAERRRLGDEINSLKAALAERDAAVARAARDQAEAKESWQEESSAALAEAQQVWSAESDARLAAAAAQWQKETARLVAEARAKTDSAQTQSNAELQQLRDEICTLKARLAAGEAALADALRANGEAQRRAENDINGAVARAQQVWKAEEDARLATLTAQWQERTAKAIVEARAETSASSAQGALSELDRLRQESEALKTAAAERETEQKKARSQWQRETQEALANTERKWKAELTSRIAAAEAQLRKQSAAALAEATSRYESAESALIQVRMRSKDETRLHQEIASLRAALANRDHELAEARQQAGTFRHYTGPERRAVVRPPRLVVGPSQQKRPMALIRDIAVAAGLGAVAITLFPSLEPHLPASWRANIAAILGGGSDEALQTAAAPSPGMQTALGAFEPEPVLETSKVVALKEANVRAAPSGSAVIVGKLASGQQAFFQQERGGWIRVRLNAPGESAREGWVHSSLVKDVDRTAGNAGADR